MLRIVAATGHHHTSPIFLGVVIAFMVVVLFLSLRNRRRGGPGPAVNWIPRSQRARLNRYYASRGWQEPFDANGDRNPNRSRL